MTFLAKVSNEGTVIEVRVLRVPAPSYGFEQATRDAVERWRFEPARLDGEPVEGMFAGTVNFELRRKDTQALEELLSRAFENWTHPPALGQVEDVRRIVVRGEPVTPSAVLESRLEALADVRTTADSLSLDAIQFEGDEAWITSSLRLQSGASSESFRTLVIRRAKRWYAFFAESSAESPMTSLEDTGPRHDFDPVHVSQPPDPRYPEGARKERLSGAVVLQVQVELDGTTTVLRAVKTLSYCNAAAIENAWKWRWKPAINDGKPVPAVGIITVTFDIVVKD